jgi:hypothetical protein
MKAHDMIWTRLVAVSLLCGAVATASLAACSPGTADQKSGPLAITFPSTSAAIATDTVEVRVFDGSVSTNDCLTLIQTEQKSQPLPKPLFDTGKTETCSYFQNQVKPFDMGYGSRAFLVVGQRAATTGATATDFLIGCTVAGIGDVSNNVNVELAVFDATTQVPASTKCSSLTDKCNKGIACY